MWSWRRRETISTAHTVPPAEPGSCRACADGLVHCHGTLVLHADGVLDCEAAECGTDPSLHEWWVPCIELQAPCGCLGDEHPAGLVAEEPKGNYLGVFCSLELQVPHGECPGSFLPAPEAA